MNLVLRLVVAVGCCVLLSGRAAAQPAIASAAADAQQRVVKIYGAGGLAGLEAYQSGFLVSPEGHVATVWSYVLDVEPVVVLDDGRRFESEIVGFEPSLELAVLKIDASDLPFFRFNQEDEVGWGDPIIAVSNLFGIAAGNEPASVMQGSVAAVTELDARRGTFKTPYRGKVLILDLIANNPGAAGGAVVDAAASALREALGDIIAGRKTTAVTQSDPVLDRRKSHNWNTLGLVMIPDVLESTPAFVDEVRDDGPAARARLRPDDLVLLINGRRVESQRGMRKLLRTIDRRDEVEFTIQRDTEILAVMLRP